MPQTMNWQNFIKIEQEKEYFINLFNVLKEENSKFTIYPNSKDVFNAFKYCSFDNTKVVIVGMDPYHGAGQAHGLSFSVQKGIDIPPSLLNIFKEIKSDLGLPIPNHGCLTSWAEQGVLLLNAALTVREKQPGSHQNIGWHIFTDKVIELINEKSSPTVFVLWGAFARKKKSLITNSQHLVLESAHPSPLSAYNGFFGCKHFSKINEFLKNNNISEIDWTVE